MRIKPLVQARIKVPLNFVFIFSSSDYLASGPIYVWLIEGEEKLLVDAGIAGKVKYPVEDERSLLNVLEKENVKAEEIEKLIITHLHFDHVANAHLFHNAKIYIQKAEWKFAKDPLPIFRDLYVEDSLEMLEKMDICLLKGDAEIADGIKLISLPGHTPGLQGVLVRAKSGSYLLSSDHFYSYLNIFPPKHDIELKKEREKAVIPAQRSPFLPPGIHSDLSDWFESCYKALRLVKKSRIIPGHDPSLEGKVFD